MHFMGNIKIEKLPENTRATKLNFKQRLKLFCLDSIFHFLKKTQQLRLKTLITLKST